MVMILIALLLLFVNKYRFAMYKEKLNLSFLPFRKYFWVFYRVISISSQ
jgi:hypothetical protein